MTAQLEIGGVLADRFVIEALAGSGGMGTVYRAHDRQSGGSVALKVCRVGAPAQVTRFSREIRALAALRHPAIVAHVTDGHTEDGQPYLAMEWLAGEDLGQRLHRRPLAPAESLALIERVTWALAAAHEAGIVHRDLKPSNVFLRGGRIEDAMLLDFGVARLGPGTLGSTLTATGSVVGTPDYMSPEQARGDREIGPAADLFSLGSLLFECLTGRTPFAADRMMAVLAKIVFEEAPRLASVWEGAPPQLDDLVARLLAKDPAARPASAAALLAELAELRTLALGPGPALVAGPALQGPEHQILSVVLASPPRPGDPGVFDGALAALRLSFTRHEGRLEALADGSIALAFGQTGHAAATDRAAQAARCALLIKEQIPTARVAVATGRGVLRGGTPGGGALERAAELLDATPDHSLSLDDDPPIWIDEVTARLIEAGFILRPGGTRRRQLLAELVSLDPARPLLGKPTPCVGRELDLAALAAVLASAVEEPGARVVVVRAPPGMGKSRLRHEFVRRALAEVPDLRVFVGRCDPMGAGSSHELLGQIVRELCGCAEDCTPDDLRGRLRAWVDDHRDAIDGPRVVAFLGELCGVPFGDEPLAALRSARQDAGLMAEQITAAFATFLRTTCATCPLLVVLEDLHWGDRSTVRAIGAALRELVDHPFVVLALARPEIDDRFPRLWEEHGPTNLTLRALGRRPCERLCRGVLGPSVSEATLDRIIEQSGGNALFLEELIRAVAEGKGEVLPESVLAMLQARLMRLAPDARRVLRAASVFGETFWLGGVRALLGQAEHEGVELWLDSLVEAELVLRDRETRLASEVAYRFRHALMRDAAYSMLGESDRIAGHRAAGRFLEAAGEFDPMVLAQHFALGQEGTRAGECYARAAEQAHARGDTSAVIARAEQAIAHVLPEHLRARLLALIAEELGWQLDFRRAGSIADEVLRMSPAGSVPWATAFAPRIFDVLLRGDHEAVERLREQVYTVVPEPEALAKVVFGVFAGAFWYYLDGDPDGATRLLARQRDLVEPVAHAEPLAHGWYCLSRSYHDAIGDAGPAAGLHFGRRCWEAFHAIGHYRGELLAQISIGKNLWMLGQFEAAEQALRGTVLPGVAYGPLDIDRVSCLIEVMVMRGQAAEAASFAAATIAATGRRNETETIFEGATRASHAVALAALGDLERAEAEARVGHELAQRTAAVGLAARTTLADVLLRRGAAGEALEHATACAAAHARRRYHGARHARAHLLRAEALAALGDPAGAADAIVTARAVLADRAARIDDEALRRSFLHAVPWHARILELESAWARSRS